jgi:peptidoglycan hydrolase CwlO-like protein
MDSKEFLEALQIVDLTRQQPELKPVHDFMLKKCVEHAKEVAEKAAEAKKAEDEKKAAEEAKAVKAEPAKPAQAQTATQSAQRYTR